MSKETIIMDMQVRASRRGPVAHVTSGKRSQGPGNHRQQQARPTRTQVPGCASARDSQVRRHDRVRTRLRRSPARAPPGSRSS